MENKGWRRGKLAAMALCWALAVSLFALSHRFPLSLFADPAQNIDNGAFHRSSASELGIGLSSAVSDVWTMLWRVPEVPSDGGASRFLCIG
jgi:hypothetical protein